MAEAAREERLASEDRALASEVRRLREERGWSQSELAVHVQGYGDLAYVSATTISRIENGSRRVWVREGQALASVFNRSVYALLHPEGPQSVDLDRLPEALKGAREDLDQFRSSAYKLALEQPYLRERAALIQRSLEQLPPQSHEVFRHIGDMAADAQAIGERDLVEVVRAIVADAERDQHG